MADTKTTALTENTTPLTTDIMYIVDDPGGSAASQRITVANLATLINGLSGRVLISEQTPTGTGTVTWSSIPATYKSLFIEFVARGTQVATNTNMVCYLNNDTTATNYRSTYHQIEATVSHTTGVANTALIGVVAAASADAGSCGMGTIWIINYAGTTFNKQIRSATQYRASSTAEFGYDVMVEWESAAAVNRVDLVLAANNYDTGSTFRLYGVF